MARINIEDKLWTDPRLAILRRITGSDELAFGKLVVAWRTAQEYFVRGENIPEDIFDMMGFMPLVAAKFAVLENGGYYLHGTREQFQWIEKKREAGRKGGQAKASNALASASITKAEPSETYPLTPALSLTPTLTQEEENTEYVVVTDSDTDYTHPLELDPDLVNRTGKEIKEGTLISIKQTDTSKIQKVVDTIVSSGRMDYAPEPKGSRFQWMMDLFNDHAKAHQMPKIKVISKERERAIDRGIKAIGSDCETWLKVFSVAGKKGFVKKEGGSWSPDFDYVFRVGNPLKFSEADAEKRTTITNLSDKIKEQLENCPY